MTVRWKPLVVLSGLFVVTALLGLVAFYAMGTRSSAELLPLARAERQAKRFENAEIHYQRALQADGRNPKIYLELAEMYADWAEQGPADQKAVRRALRLRALADAAKYGKTLAEPRRQLLADALWQEEPTEAAVWAKELLPLDPQNSDAHYALARQALSGAQPNVAEARRYLVLLEAEKPHRIRTDWIKARIAQEAHDPDGLNEVLTKVRATELPEKADPVDRMARLQLRVIDLEQAAPEALGPQVRAAVADAESLANSADLAPTRVTQIGLILGRVRKLVTTAAGQADASARAPIQALGGEVERVIEATFSKALESTQSADLRIYLAYAQHLATTEKRQRCLDVVDEALKLKVASLPAYQPVAMDLREVGIKAALSDTTDEKRFTQAAPYIKDLIASSSPRYQGLGHLFQGAIELEQTGLSSGTIPSRTAGQGGAEVKLRTSALGHLKTAAAQWPGSPTAQALYGIALILSDEHALGRQYLQTARNLGRLEAQYQIWAAWSLLEAGYPEDADPIVTSLLEAVALGQQPRDLESTLHLLRGEIAQARRAPTDLALARAEYQKAFPTGEEVPPSVTLRLAQLDVQMGHPDVAMKRLEALRAAGQGGAGADHLAVLILLNQDQADQARKLLDQARKDHPESPELLGLDVALHLKADDAQGADRLMVDFLKHYPNHIGAIQMRAQVLAERLDRVEDARTLLANAAERCENSAPLVQLALLDLGRKDYPAASQTIAKIRSRWKEAASADLLDAQLALARENLPGAAQYLDAALKKDPTNKIALFWKAQIEDRDGGNREAERIFSELAREKSGKELESGLSLSTAAEWALAQQALNHRDPETAIHRLEGLLRSGEAGPMDRPIRWKLVAARIAKGEWPAAKAEIVQLVKDPSTTADEIVQAANYYRQNQEPRIAIALLDRVLKYKPAHSGAAVSKAYILIGDQKQDEARDLLHETIAASKDGPQPTAVYLLLAAVENSQPDSAAGLKASLVALEDGLKVHPDALDLIQAKAGVLKMMGDPEGSLALIEARAQPKTDPQGKFRRLLAETFAERKDFVRAEQVIRDLRRSEPKDPKLAALQVRMVLAQVFEAIDHGDRDLEAKLAERTNRLIRQCRKEFPSDLAFPQAECELAARRGDLARAIVLTQEMDRIDTDSPTGALLRAQIYALQGWAQGEAKAYAEALERSPRRDDVRLALGQASLALGQPDAALHQVDVVLAGDADQPAARLLKARALVALEGSPTQAAARRAEASRLLQTLIHDRPQFSAAFHQLSEVRLTQGDRAGAIATLKDAMKAVPDDATGLALLIQYLTEPRDGGQGPTPADLKEAQDLAESCGARDESGHLCLALAVGLHKAGQLDLAEPWAQKAAAQLDAPAVHLAYGDLLLSRAEATHDPDQAREIFTQAVAQYDAVLKVQANSIEAINNKAWILHEHLGDDRAALALAEGLARRLDASALPGEFFDTLGAIQEAMGKTKDAEDSYSKGLRKSPDHPVLNFHMGKLVASDRSRQGKAEDYLRRASQSKDKLPPTMVAEVERLLDKVGRHD